MYVYRFWNNEDEIIYIGRSKNLSNRLNNHTHLPRECYDSVCKVEYCKLTSDDESAIYERYLINKHSPKHNTMLNNGSKFNFDLPEVEWYILNDFNFEEKKSTKGWVKFNPTFDFDISFINVGRVLILSKYMKEDGSICISRLNLMNILNFETNDSLSKFLSELSEKNIIYRKNKFNRKEVEFMLSDNIFIKQ